MHKATVIIAAWGAESTLRTSVRSALDQRDVDVELVIVEDCSPDGTLDVAEELARRDDRVRAIPMMENGGPAAARNRGLAEAKGAWVAVLDADDTMAPERLGRLIDVGEATGADVVADHLCPVTPSGDPVPGMRLAYGGDVAAPTRLDLATFLAGCQAEPGRLSLGYLKPVMRRATLSALDLRYDETLRNGEDFHLMAELLAQGATFYLCPEATYRYTVRAGSVSHRLEPEHARALLEADRAFLVRHAARLAPQPARLMRRRTDRLGDFVAAEATLAALKARNVPVALRTLVGRPRAVGRTLRQLAQAAKNRMSKRGA